MVNKSSHLPEVVKENLTQFHRFLSLSYFIAQFLLSCLSDALNLEGTARLEQRHRTGEPSNTTVGFLHYFKDSTNANAGIHKHTDIGSLTLLFTQQWGLQVLLPDSRSWAFVQPKPGHVVVNVGDLLRFISGMRLKSCVHRVVPSIDDRRRDRYSIAYLLRPENAAKFEDNQGNRVTAEGWWKEKLAIFSQGHEKQAVSSVLTGGMESAISLE